VLDWPSVFFVPPYDIYYYKALIAQARAQAARPSGALDDQERALAEAIGYWRQYLDEAERAGHRWVPNARAELGTVERSLKALRAGRGRRTPPPSDLAADRQDSRGQ
jgi:GH15 family glucan-1,4-alpha-glucosidase